MKRWPLEALFAGSGGVAFPRMPALVGAGGKTTLMYALARRMAEARKKHPVFAEGKYHALGVIGAEYEELVRAVERETPERVRDEALDVAVTALRLWAGEEICL